MKRTAKVVPGTWAAVLRTVADRGGYTVTDVRRIAEELIDTLKAETWRHGRVVVPHFASLRVRARKARDVLSPDGQRMRLPGGRTVAMRPTSDWRNR